jgi:hypothetical protein
MELGFIIMIGIMAAAAIGLVLLGRAANAAEARYERLLEQYPEYRGAMEGGRADNSKHLFE